MDKTTYGNIAENKRADLENPLSHMLSASSPEKKRECIQVSLMMPSTCTATVTQGYISIIPMVERKRTFNC